MWWFTALLSALLVAQCAEGAWIQREMSTIPLMDMTDTDIQKLSTAILTEFTNAGFSCPERAQSMLAFGLMMPKIKMPITFPRVNQLVFGPTTMVPASVQDEISQIVIDDVVAAYSHHIKGLPEYPTLFHSLGSVIRRCELLVNEVVNSPVAAKKMTGADLLRHIHGIIESLKGISCEKMITIKLKSFMTKVTALFTQEVIVNQDVIGSIRDKVHIAIPNNDIARKVIPHVTSTTKWIIQNMHDTVLAMAQAVPNKLPIDFYLRNLVTMSLPEVVPPYSGVAPAAYGSPAVFQFPVSSDPCYEQRLAAYNTVLLRAFSTMRMNMVGHLLMGHVKDATICKPLSRLIKYGLIEDIMPESLVAALKPITAEWWKLRISMIELKRAGQLNRVTIVDPINELLNVISGPKICAIKPAILMSIVGSAFSSYQQTIVTDVDVVAKYLKGKIAAPVMAEFMAVYKPMAQAFQVAFNAMYADYQVNTMTEKPIFAIVEMLKYLDTYTPAWWNQGACMASYSSPYVSIPTTTSFKPTMFKKIGSKNAHILTGMEGDMNWPFNVEVTGGQPDVYVDEGLEDVLGTWGNLPIAMIPSEVVMNTIIASTHKLQQQVPAKCRLPIGIKFLAAIISSHEQMGAVPDYPLVPLLAPVLQAVNPAYPMPLEKVKEIIGMFAYQLHMASTKAMANLGIFKGMEPIMDLVKAIIGDVTPGATIPEIYKVIQLRLSAFVPDVTLCKGMSFDAVLADGFTFMDRLFNSPELSSPSLDAVLSGIIPAYTRKPIINALITGGLPLIEGGVRQFMWKAAHVIPADPMFAKFHSGFPVGTGSFDFTPIGDINPQVYKLFLEELKTHLVSHLVPITHLPVEVLNVYLAEAYMKTLHILGIPV